jgi:hypothetical protein
MTPYEKARRWRDMGRSVWYGKNNVRPFMKKFIVRSIDTRLPIRNIGLCEDSIVVFMDGKPLIKLPIPDSFKDLKTVLKILGVMEPHHDV